MNWPLRRTHTRNIGRPPLQLQEKFDDYFLRLCRSAVQDPAGLHYARHHRARALELVHVLRSFAGSARTLCEVGVGHYSFIYRELFPHLGLTFADKFDHARSAAIQQGIEFHQIDLERSELATVLNRAYDIVIFTEVLEHLNRSPAEVLLDLSRCLAAGGVLIISTPNFGALNTWRTLAAGLNPAMLPTTQNEDAHYHVREYTLRELLAFLPASLSVVLTCYSDCWDREKRFVKRAICRLLPALRSNILVVCRKL